MRLAVRAVTVNWREVLMFSERAKQALSQLILSLPSLTDDRYARAEKSPEG